MKEGALYIVATPIGNLEDMTLRALRVLREVDAIACEDTRVTSKLLARYEISKPLVSYHHHSPEKVFERILGDLREGKNIALVTDAGTPGVSDPGNELVARVAEADIAVIPIPGASAVASIISVSGIDMQKFTFLGFPPHKKGRQTFFERVSALEIPVVYYDSSHRVIKNLGLLASLKPDARIILGRELTKMFEEILRGNVAEVLEILKSDTNKQKGEFTVIVF